MLQRTALLGLALLPLLCACHHIKTAKNSCNKPALYAKADSVPPIHVPAGIDRPDTHAALHIPQLNEPAPPPRKLSDPCLDVPPPYAVPRTPRTTASTN